MFVTNLFEGDWGHPTKQEQVESLLIFKGNWGSHYSLGAF